MAGGFVRNFTADEIVAFARAFDQPVTWFFMPPPPWAGPGMPAKLAVPDAPAFGQALALLVDLVFGDEVGQAQLVLRLDAFLDEVGPDGLTEAQARVASLARQRTAALVRQSFADLGRWQTSLRSLANQLEDLEVRAKHLVAFEVGVASEDLRITTTAEGPALGRELDHRAGDEPHFTEAEPADVEGDQPPPAPRKHRPPSSPKKSTRRKS
ncbi:MAG TPA: hypothetical protein VK975_07545 [Acidimicrobiales bacterium]|nr:hypothetical protein [Acidimicrobiales bacterium]